MKIIDSHCHLDKINLAKFNNDFDNILIKADEFHVKEFLCVCIDFNNFNTIVDLAERYTQIYTTVGLHPANDIGVIPTVEKITKLANNKNIIAIGETGLDYFHIKDNLEWQQERFKNHIKAANICHKPLIIHMREATKDTLKIMQDENATAGIMHCFVEDIITANIAIEMGFYISFSGVLTFNSARNLQAVAKNIPLDKILVETDSPYLSPVPFRGKENHPANTYFVVEKLASLRNISIQEVAETTTNNFHKLFGL